MKRIKYYYGYFWIENNHKIVCDAYVWGYSPKWVANELRKERNKWLRANDSFQTLEKGDKLIFRVKRKKWDTPKN